MYLIVFVTLVIAILGTYTQVLAIEVARVAAAQTSVAQAMLSWHTAAVSMAASIIDSNLAGYTAFEATGCSLSNDHNGSNLPSCPSPSGTDILQTNGTITNSLATSSSPYMTNKIYSNTSHVTECVHLPGMVCSSVDLTNNCNGICTTTFDARDYEFYSILFRSGGTDYVVTYAGQPTVNGETTTSPYIQLASGAQLSLTPAGLIKQFRTLGLSTASYGTVTGNSIIGSIAFSFTLPTYASVPTGAVALVTSPNGF